MRLRFLIVPFAFLLLPPAVQAQALLTHVTPAFRTIHLLERPDVIRELRLDAGKAGYVRIQARAAGELQLDEQEKNVRDPEAIRQNLPKIIAAIRADIVKSLGDNLKDAQLERLLQLERQALGVRTFAYAEVQAALELTPEQQVQIQRLLAEIDQEDRQLFTDMILSKNRSKTQEVIVRLQELPREATPRALSLLTPAQRARWNRLAGAPFPLRR